MPGGGLLLDTPGMRELQLWESDDGLAATFDDVESLAARCRFRDCTHETEPGCAVREGVEAGTLPAERLESFRKLAGELRHLAVKTDQGAASEQRRRWRTLHKAAKKHKPRG